MPATTPALPGTGPGGCCDEANFRASHPAQIVLAGAIVGGPDQSDVYPDIRECCISWG